LELPDPPLVVRTAHGAPGCWSGRSASHGATPAPTSQVGDSCRRVLGRTPTWADAASTSTAATALPAEGTRREHHRVDPRCGRARHRVATCQTVTGLLASSVSARQVTLARTCLRT
jgi:hypothetical protein